MNLWFIAIPVVFGVIIAALITLCCCCSCSPRKSADADEDVAEVIEVVLYPDGTQNHPNSPDGGEHHRESAHAGEANPNSDGNASREVRNGGDGERQVRSFNERLFQYRYYPLQAGEQRPVTAAVAGTGLTRTTVPCEGKVVAGGGGRAEVRTRAAREPASYGQATYVSSAEAAVGPPTPAEN